MNILKEIFSVFKNKLEKNNKPSFIQGDRKKCFNCGRKGVPTDLFPGESFACKRCNVWWVN